MPDSWCAHTDRTAPFNAPGARTGVSSIFVALFFAMSIVFAPIFVSIPQCAISPILIVVGVMMMQVRGGLPRLPPP